MNFWLYKLTGQTCSVAPFSKAYDPMPDVQIVTCLIAYDDKFGRTWILVFNEVLCFCNSMDHSLVNPNQIRVTDIPVLDDPFDKTRNLGIDHDHVFIPFQGKGTTIYFNMRVLTETERSQCTWVTMTGYNEWDPLSVQLADVHTNKEEAFRMIAASRHFLSTKCKYHIDNVMGGILDIFLEQTMSES